MNDKGRAFPEWAPPEIVSAYSEKNITSLFDWQAEVLDFAETNDDNIVFCAPTSAGKSIVAELIALRAALSGKRVLFLLPYISVAKEKLRFLQRAWRRLDVQVAAFVGAQSAPSREWTAAVCTTEKANSLLNHAMLDGLMDEIGLIVIDELHMIFDPSRGGILESLCAKINLWNTRNRDKRIRMIGMSATLESLNAVGQWLNAKVFETHFRPVDLNERICCDGHISDLSTGNVIRDVPKRFRVPEDPECVLGLAAEGIYLKKLVLVFSSSKADVEKIALDLAKILDGIYRSNNVIAGRVNRAGLQAVQLDIQRSAGTLDPILAQTLPRGVAFHHAGLTSEERECIEQGFRNDVIMVLVATSTLSSGVNLPAGRVVIKAQIRGPAAINATTYKQMSGRAGRLGQVEIGESILAVKKSDLREALRLIRLSSSMSERAKRDHTRLTLECVCDGLTTRTSELEEISNSTLFEPLKSGEDIVCDLVKNHFLTVDGESSSQDSSILAPTQLGRATLVSALPPDAALFVFADLQQATRAVALETELHMLYLVTPSNCSIWQGCDWNHLHSIFTKLDDGEKRVAKLVGANDRFLLSRLRGTYTKPSDRSYQLHLRFFSALALYDVVNEKPIDEVARRFRISRGTLQTLQQQSATYAAMVVAFCSRLGWTYLHDLLKGFAARLAFGVRRELTELVSIDGLDASRARIFHDNDITSFAQLSNCPTSRVAEILSLAVPFNSENTTDGLNEWLFGEPRMRLVEAADLLRERASVAVKEHLRSLGLNVDSLDQLSQTISKSPAAKKDVKPPKKETRRSTKDRRSNSTIDVTPPNRTKKPTCRRSSLASAVPKRVALREIKKNVSNAVELNNTGNSSMLEEHSIDLFSESMEELTIDDSKPARRRSIVNRDEFDETIDDLESSLSKVSFICEKENQLPPSGSAVHSSFADSGYSEEFCGSGEPSVHRDSKMPAVSLSQHPSHKRLRNNNKAANSPTSKSPAGKTRRIERPNHSKSTHEFEEFDVDDVCRTESAWNQFVKLSSSWSRVGAALAIKHRLVESVLLHGISFCTPDGTPKYIPLSDEYFPGNDAEEALCPSSTPSQSISLDERLSRVTSILQSCEVIFTDALSDCRMLWKSFQLKVSEPISVSYVAFLAHLREGEQALPIRDIAAKYKWDIDINKMLRMNPRISSAVQSYLAPRLLDLLSPLAVQCSSEDSLRLEVRSVQVVDTMCLDGFHFDEKMCRSLVKKIKERIESLEQECCDLAGRNFNLGSPSQVAEVLFTRLKLPHPGGAAKKQHMSTNKAVLEQMKSQHPIVEKILEHRHLSHAMSQIIPLQRFVGDDGFIRPHCEMHTATGRILTYEPNLQNIPKDVLIDDLSIRHLFVAQKGCILMSADYSQLELRVLAHLSEDPSLIEHLSSGRDFFKELAAKWQVTRETVKTLCYGIIYGMGGRTMGQMTNKSVADANKLIQNFFKEFPKVRTYINNTKDKGVDDGYVTTYLGRRRVTNSAKGRQKDVARDDRQSMNYTVQGTASEIFKKALVRMDDTKMGSTHIVLTIHDEVIVECAEEDEEETVIWIRDCLENVFPDFRVPLPVKVRKGPNWGSLTSI